MKTRNKSRLNLSFIVFDYEEICAVILYSNFSDFGFSFATARICFFSLPFYKTRDTYNFNVQQKREGQLFT